MFGNILRYRRLFYSFSYASDTSGGCLYVDEVLMMFMGMLISVIVLCLRSCFVEGMILVIVFVMYFYTRSVVDEL